MTGPEIALHVDEKAEPYAAHTPAPVPLHWHDAVKTQLDKDVNMGVLEKVPIGEPSQWCHRMVITPKTDGSPRRTVDLSPLNAFCLRETHHVQPPFKQGKKVPSQNWITVTDAWNGFHSVPIRHADCNYTTVITPWGDIGTGSHPKDSLPVEMHTPGGLTRLLRTSREKRSAWTTP